MSKNRIAWLMLVTFVFLMACGVNNIMIVRAPASTTTPIVETVVITATLQPGTPTATPTRTRTPAPTRTLVPSGARQQDIASDPLVVVMTSPGDQGEDIPTSKETTRIVAQFNHPVVPLSAIELQSELPQPLKLDPPVPGRGKWINTSTFAFTPDADLGIATQYKATISSLKDILGQTLTGYSWSFKTTAPAIIKMDPSAATKFVGVRQPITITFNTEMDTTSVVAHWSLKRSNTLAPIAGRYQFAGNVFRFFPDQPLEYNARYVAKLEVGAQDARQGGMTIKDWVWAFTTVPTPGVKTAIADGEANVKSEDLFRMNFNSPMDQDSMRVSVAPTLTRQSLYWTWGESLDARVYGNWEASTAYTVTIHGDSKTRDGEELGKDTVVHFKTAPITSQVSLALPGVTGMYDVNGEQKLFASYINVNQVDYQLFRIDRQDLIALNGDTDQRFWWNTVAREDTKLREWSRRVESPLNTWGVISTTLGFDGKRLDAGMYLLQVKSPQADYVERRQILVTDLNLALKHTENEVLVWATSFQTGKPIANQLIAVYEGGTDTPLAAGITDKDGVWRARIRRINSQAPLIALSESGNRIIAAVGSDWNAAMSVWDFGVSASGSMQKFYTNIYTDRAIYRPGQTVYVRGIVRRDEDTTYTLPDDLEHVTINVRDSNSHTLLEREVQLNRFGTFNDEIKLGDDAAIGEYTFELAIPSTPHEFPKRVYFRVAEYRRPEFSATMQTNQNAYMDGDTIRLTGDAAYYFGGGVGDATINWTVMAENLSFYPPNLTGDWEFNDYDTWSETNYRRGVINAGTAKTNKDGTFQIDIPALIGDMPASQSFTLQAEITDINNQSVSLNTMVPVHRAQVYVGVRPQRYVGVVGEEQTLDLITVNPKGITVTQQTLAVSFFQREWFSVRERDDDGMFYWKNSYTDTLVSKINVTTDARGYTTARFKPPRGGYYKVLVETQDANYRAVRAATFVWISGDVDVHWRQENHDRIQLIADKKIYAPGDVAEVLIPAPFRNAEALLTIERGTIREVRHLTLRGNSERVKIPIASNYTPDVFVSVMLFKGRGADGSLPQFKIGYVQLTIETREKELRVEVTPDKTTPYAPGETAMFTINATDFAGKPVEAEFSVALVDKAVQALVGDNSETLMTSFYSNRPLSVHTATTFVLSVDRVIQDLQLGAKGGGGGPAFDQADSVRRNFRDTAYWNANVFTDASGRAQIAIPLPDNLTTWNLAAKGVTIDTRVGDARVEIVSAKPLLVRPVTPRFFVVNDHARLETVVHNNTDRAAQTQVRLEATGLIARDALTQTLMIPAHDKLKAGWNVTVTAQDQVVVRFSAASESLRDAVEQTLPVRLPISLETVATAGQVETRTVERIQLPANVDPRAGELRVELNPSLAAASRTSLKYLESFDYECSEQTVSKFFPNVATYRALKELGVEREELRRGLETNVTREVQRLYALQRNDGGWGWWLEDRSRPTLTAYALLALYHARQAGFTVDNKAMEWAEKFLMHYLDEPTDVRAASTFNERAFVIFVLAEMERPMTSRAVSLFDQRANASQYGKAFLLMALHHLHQPQADTLKTELTSAAILTASGAHWEESFRDVWAMNTDTRTTAIVVMALARSDSKSVALANAVRWLMVARKDGHWETTQETAWSVLALTDFMLTTGELNADYTFHATMNGAAIGEGKVNKANVDQARVLTVAVKDLVQSAANDLVIARDTGDGRLYYSAYLNYFLPAEKLEPLNRGVMVTRLYEAVDPFTLKPTGRTIQSAKIGDYVRVTLSVIAPNDVYYFALEDPLPAGLEAVDTQLRTTNIAAVSAQLRDKRDAQVEYLPYWVYWAHTEMRDDRVAAFATYLPRGTYEYVYLARASIAGEFRALPARAWEMYFPDIFGRSAGSLFTVTSQ